MGRRKYPDDDDFDVEAFYRELEGEPPLPKPADERPPLPYRETRQQVDKVLKTIRHSPRDTAIFLLYRATGQAPRHFAELTCGQARELLREKMITVPINKGYVADVPLATETLRALKALLAQHEEADDAGDNRPMFRTQQKGYPARPLSRIAISGVIGSAFFAAGVQRKPITQERLDADIRKLDRMMAQAKKETDRLGHTPPRKRSRDKIVVRYDLDAQRAKRARPARKRAKKKKAS